MIDLSLRGASRRARPSEYSFPGEFNRAMTRDADLDFTERPKDEAEAALPLSLSLFLSLVSRFFCDER